MYKINFVLYCIRSSGHFLGLASSAKAPGTEDRILWTFFIVISLDKHSVSLTPYLKVETLKLWGSSSITKLLKALLTFKSLGQSDQSVAGLFAHNGWSYRRWFLKVTADLTALEANASLSSVCNPNKFWKTLFCPAFPYIYIVQCKIRGWWIEGTEPLFNLNLIHVWYTVLNTVHGTKINNTLF